MEPSAGGWVDTSAMPHSIKPALCFGIQLGMRASPETQVEGQAKGAPVVAPLLPAPSVDVESFAILSQNQPGAFSELPSKVVDEQQVSLSVLVFDGGIQEQGPYGGAGAL